MTGFEPIEILLAEDSEADAEMTIRALQRNNLANRLVWVKDGAEALDFIFRRGAYASDPRGRPSSCCSISRCRKSMASRCCGRSSPTMRRKTMPVVMLTSSAEERDIVASYSLGVNSYIVKPVDFANFVDEVAKAGCYWVLVNCLPGTGERAGARANPMSSRSGSLLVEDILADAEITVRELQRGALEFELASRRDRSRTEPRMHRLCARHRALRFRHAALRWSVGPRGCAPDSIPMSRSSSSPERSGRKRPLSPCAAARTTTCSRPTCLGCPRLYGVRSRCSRAC